MAKFREVFKCWGVDELAQPAGMIVPFGGQNWVALTDGQGLHVHSDNSSIAIEEIDEPAGFDANMDWLRKELAKPGVDPVERIARAPDVITGQPRFFTIRGKTKVGSPGALVQVSSGRKPNVTLRVVVLERKQLKLSIRNVQVPDASGKVVFHAKKPCDPKAQCDGMNVIWTAQTQIAFDLVTSDPIFIDDREKSMREKLATALELREKEASFPAIVDPDKVKNLFKELNERSGAKADFTIFVVDKLHRGKDSPDGTTFKDLGIAFIAGNHLPTTFPHEAGHFLGRGLEGVFDASGHIGTDPRLLMRDGGAGWKIPFDLAIKFRKFFERH